MKGPLMQATKQASNQATIEGMSPSTQEASTVNFIYCRYT